MLKLDRLLKNAWENEYCSNNYHIYTNSKESSKIMMDIPICSDKEFELPVFAVDIFIEELPAIDMRNSECCIKAMFTPYKNSNPYDTVDSNIRLVIDNIPRNKLIRFTDNSTVYYGTRGLILDSQLKPMVTLSWIMRPMIVDDKLKFSFEYPLMRISPQCFINQGNAVERYISKKLPVTALSACYNIPFRGNWIYNVFDSNENYRMPKCKVIIEDNPLKISLMDTPSILTTSAGLRELVLNHIDEVMQ